MNNPNPLRQLVPSGGSPERGVAERREFGAVEVSAAQNRAVAIAAQVKAQIEARYVMALQRPRDIDQARQDIMRECSRPSFADNPSALYRKPIGAGVEGLGIRFVEMALSKMRNVLVSTRLIDEDAGAEVHEVEVTDLETNVSWPMQIRVSKTVERSKPADDGSYIAVRMNSRGNPVYTVPANDEDLLNKRAALISKAVRTLGLRIIPGDLQAEAEELIRKTREDRAAADPDAERKRIVDAFGSVGVRVDDLKAFVGHDLATLSPAEVRDLRGVFGAIRDGEATWSQVVENKRAEGAKEPAKEPPKAPAGKVDKSTGEIVGGDLVGGGPTFGEVAAMLDNAKTVDDVDGALTFVAALPEANRTILEKRAKEVRAKLAKGAKQ